ncbi:MAG: arsenate reductase/protein-tyrosine-phosphatase family protein [Promethearchaeota archaeon]
MSKITNILITCTGNTARSPVGEYLAKYYASKYNITLNIESAGEFNAFDHIQPESREFLDSKGIEYSDFRPQTINKELLKLQDLIITMAEHHKEHIFRNFGEIENIKKKTFTLKEFNGGKGDIIDPYYTNSATYKKVMKQIDTLIEQMILKIKAINENV